MSIMKDYMDKTMEGVEKINIEPNDKMEQTDYLVLKNVDNGCGTRLDVKNGIMVMEFLLSFSNLLGKVPVHEFMEIENENAIIVYFNIKQILFMIERIKSFGINDGTKAWIREFKFLLDCIDPGV